MPKAYSLKLQQESEQELGKIPLKPELGMFTLIPTVLSRDYSRGLGFRV